MASSERIVIRHKKHLELIRDEWEEVYENSRIKSPFLSFEYVKLWYDCFADPDRVRVYRVEDSGKTIGFVPLVLISLNGFRCLHNLTNDHSFHGAPLVFAGFEDRFQAMLMQGLAQTRSSWDMFRYSFTYSFSLFPQVLPDHLLQESGMKWEKWVQPTYVVRVERPFSLYLRTGISPSTRKDFTKKRNRLAKAGEVVFRHYVDSEALNHWGTFVAIEGSGWKGQAGSSISRLPANYLRFYQGLIDILSRNRVLHLYFLELNGVPIAGAISYQEANILHYAKAGFDENFSIFSPSNMLLLYILEDIAAHNQDIEKLNQFPYDYGYKHRYTNDEAFCTETIIYSKTLGGYAAYILKGMKQNLKGLIDYFKKRLQFTIREHQTPATDQHQYMRHSENLHETNGHLLRLRGRVRD